MMKKQQTPPAAIIAKHLKRLAVAILLLGLITEANAQTVSSVEAKAIGDKIQVTCSVTTDVPVDLFLSYSENGKDFKYCSSISGDVLNQEAGNKTILWDYVMDGIIMGNYVFKVSYISSVIDQPNKDIDAKLYFSFFNMGKRKKSSIILYMDDKLIGETDMAKDFKFEYTDEKPGAHKLRVVCSDCEWNEIINTSIQTNFNFEYENRKTGFGYKPYLELKK
jgi:hypothetical protein